MTNELKKLKNCGWRDISTAPRGELISVGYGESWACPGIIKAACDELDETYCQLMHYNGDVLLHDFHPTHWKPLDTPETDREALLKQIAEVAVETLHVAELHIQHGEEKEFPYHTNAGQSAIELIQQALAEIDTLADKLEK